MNVLCTITENKKALNLIYNVAVGERTTLDELFNYLKIYLAEFDIKINKVNAKYGPKRVGDIPHSLASIVRK